MKSRIDFSACNGALIIVLIQSLFFFKEFESITMYIFPVINMTLKLLASRIGKGPKFTTKRFIIDIAVCTSGQFLSSVVRIRALNNTRLIKRIILAALLYFGINSIPEQVF